jgi:3-oxoacyl-[acyl-carrier-protein] synthase-3
VSSPELQTRPPAKPPEPSYPALTGLGCFLPDTVVSNATVAARAGVDEGWIEKRTGIRSRRRATDLELVDLATSASRAALADAELEAGEIDLVLLATVSQGRPMPNVAPQIAARLGANRAGAFDVGAACSGFVMGLATAAAFIEASRARHVLVVAADLLSRQTDERDRRTAALFGDGAGAAVLSASAGDSRWAFALGADGHAAELIASDPDSGLIRMNGHETFIQAVRRMEEATRDVCDRAGVGLDDVNLFVFHQANGRITSALRQRLALEEARVVDCIAELGNTSAASIPLALEHASRSRRLTAGDTVLLCAVGAGFIWGAALIEWGGAR